MQRLISVIVLVILGIFSVVAEDLSLSDFKLIHANDSICLGQDLISPIIFQGKEINLENNPADNEWTEKCIDLDKSTKFFYFEGSRKIIRIITRNNYFETNRGIRIGNTIVDLLKVYKPFFFIKNDNSWILFYQWEEDSFITTEYYLEFKINKDKVIEEISLGIASQ